MTVLIAVGATLMARVVPGEPIAAVQGVGMALTLLALVAITRPRFRGNGNASPAGDRTGRGGDVVVSVTPAGPTGAAADG